MIKIRMTTAIDPSVGIDTRARRASRDLILASLPAALLGAWTLASQLVEQSPGAAAPAPAWQLRVLDSMGLAETGPLAQGVLGLVLLIPPVLVALGVSRAWAELFARRRNRPLDASWVVMAWLLVLLLPAGTPLYQVALGMSFGAILGCHVFGGTGRYLVNPALLGATFILVAYPGTFTAGSWLPGTELASTWQSVATQGIDAVGASWREIFLGHQLGAIGGASAAASLAGAALLVVRRRIAWQSVVGAVAGLVIAAWNVASLPWEWQAVLGSFAFVTVFVLTDPTTAAKTAPGCWLQAVTFGMLTVLIRMANPEHPEGTLFALLLAMLSTPLFDHLALRWRILTRRRRHAR